MILDWRIPLTVGPAVALPADMETSTYGRISAAVVRVETAAPGNGPALPLPTPPETPHHISATVVLGSVVIFTVIPEKAGIQRPLAANAYLPATGFRIPAFAGMTESDAWRPIFLN